jgi:hypothetical protein
MVAKIGSDLAKSRRPVKDGSVANLDFRPVVLYQYLVDLTMHTDDCGDDVFVSGCLL